jgi:outer membrane protein assembly factor BamC
LTNRLMLGGVFFIAINTFGCQYLQNMSRVDYSGPSDRPPLEVPPDLAIPDSSSNASAGASRYAPDAIRDPSRPSPSSSVLLPQYADVKLVREGQSRYLVVNAEPANVWEKIRSFFPKNNLEVEREDAGVGVIETAWTEGRVVLGPKNANFFMKLISIFRGTDKYDKFRIRLERGAVPGTTEIYLTHVGLQALPRESYDQPGAAGWESRQTEPDLEAEMLQRLVLHIGAQTETATSIAAAVKQAPAESQQRARLLRSGNGAPALALHDTLDRAWRRVGLSLDRAGFTVEDRDRSRGVYYVRYIDPDKPEKRGWFGSEKRLDPDQYQIYVASAAAGSLVEVRNKDGVVENSKVSERILGLLQEQLR